MAAGEASSSERSGGSGERGGQGGQAIADVTATHGNESSFETIVSLDPDHIFVMDRDAAISTEGAQLAREMVVQTPAEKPRQVLWVSLPGFMG